VRHCDWKLNTNSHPPLLFGRRTLPTGIGDWAADFSTLEISHTIGRIDYKSNCLIHCFEDSWLFNEQEIDHPKMIFLFECFRERILNAFVNHLSHLQLWFILNIILINVSNWTFSSPYFESQKILNYLIRKVIELLSDAQNCIISRKSKIRGLSLSNSGSWKSWTF
jgi:hypothetical protein